MDKAVKNPVVHLVGEINHPDFREAIALIRSDAQVAEVESLPELIVLAQSRPDTIGSEQVNELRRAAPLAGVAALLGSWCEGETRTGRPWPGVQRLYSYEFSPWWREQMHLRSTRHCPDWARPARPLTRQLVPGHPQPRTGLVVIRTPHRENAQSLADVLDAAGHSTAWQRDSRARTQTRGALAGIWDGGQLSGAEVDDLAAFCAQMSRDGAPVVAILDFPRRDGIDRAYESGATVVLGKPWLNHDVLAVLEAVTKSKPQRRAA